MSGWLVDGRAAGWLSRLPDCLLDGWMGGWLAGWYDGWLAGCTVGWMG